MKSVFRFTKKVYRAHFPAEYQKAGATDLIELLPAPGSNPLFIQKEVLETLVSGIAQRELIHLSGPTGSAKSSLIEALALVPENFLAISSALGLPRLPLKLYPVEMCTFEAPGELYQRRAIKNGTTYDEPSLLVKALQEAVQIKDGFPVIWLREMGRVHSSSVQGGLLNLMTKGDIILPDGRRLNGQPVAWIADSNYQAEGDATHTLVTFDDALKRRFTINLSLTYLSAEQELHVLQQLIAQTPGLKSKIAPEVPSSIVKLGQEIRLQRAEGNLQSLVPPTIYGYLAFLRRAAATPHFSPLQVAEATLLGNASREDKKLSSTLCKKVFGFDTTDDDDNPTMNNLF